MKKQINLLATLITTSYVVLPLTACTYNDAMNEAKQKILKEIATESSSVIKSLAFSTAKNADTSQLIDDTFNRITNHSLVNYSNGQQIDNWDKFVNLWGNDSSGKKSIIYQNDRDPNQPADKRITPTGAGSLTNSVKNNISVNNALQKFDGNGSLIKIVDNSTLASLIFDKTTGVQNTIKDFLNKLKVADHDNIDSSLRYPIELIKNIAVGLPTVDQKTGKWTWDKNAADPGAFYKNFADPLQLLLNNLVDGAWDLGVDGSETKTPANFSDLSKFMSSWVYDKNEPKTNYYSQWTDGGNWGLDESSCKGWNEINYNFYYSGTILNHLVHQIGMDYNITNNNKTSNNTNEENNGRYFTEIFADHLVTDPFRIDTAGLVNDLKQYLEPLFTNPSYIIQAIESFLPIILYYGFNFKDVNDWSANSNRLTQIKFGTSDTKNYLNTKDSNFGNALKRIKTLIQNEKQFKDLVSNLLIAPLDKQNPINSFLFDFKFIIDPLPLIWNTFDIKQTIIDFINSDNFNNIRKTLSNYLDSFDNIYDTWVNQFQSSSYLNIDLKNLIDFLYANNNKNIGFIKLIYINIIKKDDDNGTLYSIINNSNPINDEELQNFYRDLGGQIEDGNYPKQFVDESIINVIQKSLKNEKNVFNQVYKIIFGISSNKINGILDIIIQSNDTWNNNNYYKYIDENNETFAQTYNIQNKTKRKGQILQNYLTYDLNYKIDNNNFHYWIKGYFEISGDDYIGDINFHFMEIHLFK